MAPLLHASRRAFSTWRTKYGFEIVGDEDAAPHSMYSTVRLVKPTLLITIGWDGLEGELSIRLQALGEPEVKLGDVVNLSNAKGLSLNRIRRGPTAGMLEARLRRVASLLEADASGLLERRLD